MDAKVTGIIIRLISSFKPSGFDKADVSPNYRIWETVNPDPYDINVVIYGKSVIGKSKAIEGRM